MARLSLNVRRFTAIELRSVLTDSSRESSEGSERESGYCGLLIVACRSSFQPAIEKMSPGEAVPVSA